MKETKFVGTDKDLMEMCQVLNSRIAQIATTEHSCPKELSAQVSEVVDIRRIQTRAVKDIFLTSLENKPRGGV